VKVYFVTCSGDAVMEKFIAFIHVSCPPSF